MDSASNKTIPGSEGPDSPSNAREFSTANVVGMFLTLSLCLLTQPYGSLFYRPYGSAFGRLVFFFWRLNPLACACEAVIIAGSLFHFVTSTWNGTNRLTLSWRFPLPFFRGGPNLGGWRRALHIHAAVLLLLRANDHGEKLATQGSPSFVDNLLAHGCTRLGSTNETPGTNYAPHSPPPIHPAVGGASVAPGSFDTTAPPATTSTLPLVGAEGFGGGDVTNSQHSPELPVRPGLLHRRTTRAGEGCPASQPDPAPPEVQLKQMRDALGRNVLAGQEKWVDLVAIVCMLVVVVKLAATTLPWPIRLAAAFMLADWYLVQLLLYLFHLDDLRESHMQPIVDAARREQSAFRGAWVGVVTHLVALPVTFYLAYVLHVSDNILRTRPPGTVRDYLLLTPIHTVELLLLIIMLVVIPHLGALFAFLPFAYLTIRTTNPVLRVCCTVAGSVSAGIVFFLLCCNFDIEWIPWRQALTRVVFIALMWVSVMHPRRFFGCGGDSVLESFLLVNIFAAVYVFFWALSTYNTAETYKPDWLDYFG